jgi:hypothetical protein
MEFNYALCPGDGSRGYYDLLPTENKFWVVTEPTSLIHAQAGAGQYADIAAFYGAFFEYDLLGYYTFLEVYSVPIRITVDFDYFLELSECYSFEYASIELGTSVGSPIFNDHIQDTHMEPDPHKSKHGHQRIPYIAELGRLSSVNLYLKNYLKVAKDYKNCLEDNCETWECKNVACTATTTSQVTLNSIDIEFLALAMMEYSVDDYNPLEVNFYATGSMCSGGDCTYTWEFSDSPHTETGFMTSHLYVTPPSNEDWVKLTVSDGQGHSHSLMRYVITPQYIYARPSPMYFHEIEKGSEIATKTLYIYNRGNTTLNIDRINLLEPYPTVPFWTSADDAWWNEQGDDKYIALEPWGEPMEVVVYLDPRFIDPGSYDTKLRIISDDPINPVLDIDISATVKERTKWPSISSSMLPILIGNFTNNMSSP